MWTPQLGSLDGFLFKGGTMKLLPETVQKHRERVVSRYKNLCTCSSCEESLDEKESKYHYNALVVSVCLLVGITILVFSYVFQIKG